MNRFSGITFLLMLSTILFCKMQSDEHIRIMTFNIRYGVAQDGPNSWEYRQSILIDCLKKHKPDILALQESMDFQVDSIKLAFPQWKSIGVGRYLKLVESKFFGSNPVMCYYGNEPIKKSKYFSILNKTLNK